MDWLGTVLIGALIGFACAAAGKASRHKAIAIVALTSLGALAGAAISRSLQVYLFGPASFYVTAGLFAVCIGVGSLLSNVLTTDERRA